MRSYWIGVAPKSSDWCPYKNMTGYTEIPREEVHMKTKLTLKLEGKEQ